MGAGAEVTRVREYRYRVFSEFSKSSVAMTPEGPLDVFDYLLEHLAELQNEAIEEKMAQLKKVEKI